MGRPRLKPWNIKHFSTKRCKIGGAPKTAMPTTTHPIPQLTPSYDMPPDAPCTTNLSLHLHTDLFMARARSPEVALRILVFMLLKFAQDSAVPKNIALRRNMQQNVLRVVHRVLQGAAQRGAQFYFVFAVLQTLFFVQ